MPRKFTKTHIKTQHDTPVRKFMLFARFKNADNNHFGCSWLEVGHINLAANEGGKV